MKNYYEILQIPRNASNNQIKAAFRRLARQYHPDYNPNDPEAVTKFREIEQAYRVLSDKEKSMIAVYPQKYPLLTPVPRIFINRDGTTLKRKIIN